MVAAWNAASAPEPPPTPPRPALIGAQPRPRVLLVGDDIPDEAIAAVRELAPTVEVCDDVDEIRQAEWDIVVTATAPIQSAHYGPGGVTVRGAGAALCVLGFVAPGDGGDPLVDNVASKGRRHRISTAEGIRCHEFEAVDDSADGELAELVTGHLLPAVKRRPQYWYLEQPAMPRWTPLFVDAERRALAAAYRRGVGSDAGEGILIPVDAGAAGRWVRWAFRRWSTVFPDRFGGLRDWDADSRWQTSAEVDVAARRQAHDERRAEVLQELADERAALDAAADTARHSAVAGVRRLLTAKGDPLRDAVAAVLEQLGFDVELSDTDPARRGDYLEDLRVTDPDAPGWVCLVEVRGYRGGAAVGDLGRIERFTKRYLAETGRLPEVRWYVVNQFHDQTPGERPAPLHANPVEVADFAADAGAMIDTRTLFRLAVALDGADPTRLAQARGVLRARRGVWPLDEHAADPPTPETSAPAPPPPVAS